MGTCLATCCEDFWLHDESEFSGVFADALRPTYSDERGQHFGCGYFDTESRLCTVYENRPDICRRHGNPGSECHIGGCTYGA